MSRSKKNKEPQYYISKINTQLLNYNVYYMSKKEKLMYYTIAFVAGGVIGLIFYGGLFKNDGVEKLATHISNIVVFVLVGFIGLKVFIPNITEKLRKKRIRTLKLQFKDFLLALGNSISGGMNFNDALASSYNDLNMQYSSDSYIVKETYEILKGIENNVSFEEMMQNLGERSGDSDIYNFATVFNICVRSGGNLKETIKRTVDIIASKISMSEEIETSLTSNKTQLLVMEFIPIILVSMMRLMSSDFNESFSSVLGVVAMTACVIILIIAYKLGQKIMSIKG